MSRSVCTGKLPRVELVEINFGDNGNGDRLGSALPAEIVQHQLVVGGMESEPRREKLQFRAAIILDSTTIHLLYLISFEYPLFRCRILN